MLLVAGTGCAILVRLVKSWSRCMALRSANWTECEELAGKLGNATNKFSGLLAYIKAVGDS